MKKALTLSFILLSATALAGSRLASPVHVQFLAPGFSEASGSLGTARNSAGTTGDIGCTSFSGFTACFADAPDGSQAFCIATGQDQLDLIRSLKGDSFLQFDSDESSDCQNLLVRNSSFDEPKAP